MKPGDSRIYRGSVQELERQIRNVVPRVPPTENSQDRYSLVPLKQGDTWREYRVDWVLASTGGANGMFIFRLESLPENRTRFFVLPRQEWPDDMCWSSDPGDYNLNRIWARLDADLQQLGFVE